MDKEAFSEYMKNRYEQQIAWYDSKASENQATYRLLQWSAIILAALTPVLIELDLDAVMGNGFGRLATLTSVLVAILTSGLKTFKYQENWITYRTTCETLRKERHFYDAELGEYSQSDDKEALFVDRVESLISRENTKWMSMHKTKTKSEGSANA